MNLLVMILSHIKVLFQREDRELDAYAIVMILLHINVLLGREREDRELDACAMDYY